MARQPDVVDSSTCQFFFNLSDNPLMDHKSRDNAKDFGYCVFGDVTEGIDVLDAVSKVDVTNRDGFAGVPRQPVVIQSVSLLY